jgi:diguanylate cyclase (GGDEF)-like protein/PAS domain S-box-containing protein
VSDLGRLRMLSTIAEQVGEGVAVVDNDAWYLYANATFASMHGCTSAELQTMHFSTFYSPAEWNGPVQALMQETVRHGVGRAEVTRRRIDGTTFAAHVTLSLLRDESGAVIGRVLCVQDITVRKQLEAQLQRAALHDPLTDLPNRRLLHDRIEHALAVAGRAHIAVAVLFIDLDGFKVINDTHGHDVGDQLLVRCAERLQGCLRDADTLARLGGDEFVVLLEGLTDSRHASSTARRILRSLAQPFKLDRAKVQISASIGIAVGTSGGPRNLLHAADSAMYKAKNSGPGQMVKAV